MKINMAIVDHASRDVVERFWDKFIDSVRKIGAKESALRWYVRHAEQYLKAFPDKRLNLHTCEDVSGYLNRQVN